jgi:hypothetical protein
MDRPLHLTLAALRLLRHHLYEYGKGVRPMFLATLDGRDLPAARRQIEGAGVAYHLHPASPTRVNVFFGRPVLIETVRAMIADRPLAELSPEEDFILGTLLGYDREQQCRRYLDRSGRAGVVAFAAE